MAVVVVDNVCFVCLVVRAVVAVVCLAVILNFQKPSFLS